MNSGELVRRGDMAPLQPLTWNDFYIPPEFQNTPPIVQMHNIVVTGQTEVAAIFGGNPPNRILSRGTFELTV
jgi:hypothetical protein